MLLFFVSSPAALGRKFSQLPLSRHELAFQDSMSQLPPVPGRQALPTHQLGDHRSLQYRKIDQICRNGA